MFGFSRLTTALALSLACLPSAAFACGGFFCNLQQPVDQAAERILYIAGKNQITAHIQIKYDGPSQAFSWVLPLQKLPSIVLSSDSVFTALDQVTAPRFTLNIDNSDPNCQIDSCKYAMANGEGDTGTSGQGGPGSVQVLLQEAIGPYDAVVIQGDTGSNVVQWLNKNSYGQPPGAAKLLDLYAQQKFVFLALKLQPNKSSKDLLPVAVTLAEPSPCLPLRLTAIAAKADMPVVAWVLGDSRAIPKNFLHVELNEATIDWFSGGGNYQTVVSKAVDLASGHAFTTEFAGPTAKLPIQFAESTWDATKLAGDTDPSKFLADAFAQNLPRTRQMQFLIQTYIPKPDAFKDKTDAEFYNCVQSTCGPSSYACDATCAAIKAAVAQQPFDSKAFSAAIQAGIIDPLFLVQKAYDSSSYLTRLYTLVSPEEMTKDPTFAFNPDLPTVSNNHVATLKPVCGGSSGAKTVATQGTITYADGSKVSLSLPSDFSSCGGLYVGPGGFGAASDATTGKGAVVSAGGLPAKRVQVMEESGKPIDIDLSHADQADALLNNAQVGKTTLDAAAIARLQATPAAANTGFCQANRSSTQSLPGLLLLAAAGLLIVRRRQSQV